VYLGQYSREDFLPALLRLLLWVPHCVCISSSSIEEQVEMFRRFVWRYSWQMNFALVYLMGVVLPYMPYIPYAPYK
jgi:hypothetical protein